MSYSIQLLFFEKRYLLYCITESEVVTWNIHIFFFPIPPPPPIINFQ